MKKIERVNNIKVIKNEDNPETPEILAESLIRISEAMKKLSKNGGLDDDGICALVVNMRGMTGKISKSDVKLVLSGLNRLKSYYIRK